MTDTYKSDRTVLIVDDFPAVLAWATRAFERDGWTVLGAGSATEALSFCQTEKDAGRLLTLLVTDLDLPDYDGIQLAKALREHDRRLPVVALSSNAAVAREWSGEMLDLTVFFAKPVRASQLISAANALIASPSSDPTDSLSPGEDTLHARA